MGRGSHFVVAGLQTGSFPLRQAQPARKKCPPTSNSCSKNAASISSGRTDRRVLFSVLASSLEDAHQKFLASGHSSSDALFIVKTETEIYLT